MASKSKILVIGSTGYIGKHIVFASAHEGHPTFALMRAAAGADQPPAKAKLLQDFQAAGGDLYDHGSLVSAIKQVDVVVSAIGDVSFEQLKDQTKIIDAIKDSGAHIKAEILAEWLKSEHVRYPDLTEALETWCYRSKVSKRRLSLLGAIGNGESSQCPH